MLRTFALALAAAVSIGAAPPNQSCEAFRVMSYNIRLDLASDGVNRWSERREQLIGQVRLMQPAILGLQEVVLGQKSDLEQALPGYAFLGVARDDGKSAGEFSNLAVDRSVFDVKSSGTFWLSQTPDAPSRGWDAAHRRIATWAHLVRKGDRRRFLALNTHLDNEGQQARLESAKQIVGWLRTNRAPDEAVLVTGDMNTEADTAPITELTSAALGLRDSRQVSNTPPVGPTGTWNNFQALPKDSRRIDFVLVDPSLEVERYAVLAWQFDGDRVASDHFPVVADVSACKK